MRNTTTFLNIIFQICRLSLFCCLWKYWLGGFNFNVIPKAQPLSVSERLSSIYPMALTKCGLWHVVRWELLFSSILLHKNTRKKCKYLFLHVIVYPLMMDGPEPKLLEKYYDQYGSLCHWDCNTVWMENENCSHFVYFIFNWEIHQSESINVTNVTLRYLWCLLMDCFGWKWNWEVKYDSKSQWMISVNHRC